MNRKVLIGIVVCAVLLASVGVAFAALTSYGPVRVVSADRFSSNGDSIVGWFWLRDTQLKNTATWHFSALPTTAASAKNSRVILRFDPLVTNKAGGGSGYDANVLVTYKGRSGATYRRLVTMRNLHPEMKDPRDTGGWGYQAQGWMSVPLSHIPASGELTVTVSRHRATKTHVAANQGACTVEYLIR
ncbi:MAG: hypothetical protein U1E26_06245 [Coriobacteriia bacterium]|nr:hypothetical protein [Coriobacteriia bacterium]